MAAGSRGRKPTGNDEQKCFEPRSGDSNSCQSVLSPLRGFWVFGPCFLRADARSYLLPPLRGFLIAGTNSVILLQKKSVPA
jgi:hypothetical protein